MVSDRLPVEYQEVEYLESTGEQWIDTGLISNAPWSVLLSCVFNDVNTLQMITGAYRNTKTYNDVRNYVRLNANGSLSLQNSSLSNAINTSTVSPSTNYVIFARLSESDNDTMSLDVNSTKYQNTSKFVATDMSIYLFAICRKTVDDDNVAGNFFFGRIYSAKYYDSSDVPVRNFIPCYRKSDSEPGMYDTVTGTFFTNSGTGTFLVGNDVHHSTVNLMESRRRILLNTPHIKSLSGSALSFRTDVPYTLKECKIHFTPKQEGTGTPSPENVRPITGWDGVEVTVCRDIIVNTEWEQGAIAGATVNYGYGYDRFKQNNVTRIRCVSLIPLDSTRTYKVVWNTDVYEVVTQPYDENGKTVAVESPHGIWQTEAYEFNSLHNVAIAIRKKNQSNITPSEAVNANVKLLSEPQTLTIPFPRTVYGGYVDLVKGEVVEEWERRDMSEFSNINKSSGTSEPWVHRFTFNHWVSGKGYCVGASNNTMCDCLENSKATVDGTFQGTSGYIYDSAISTVEEFRSKYAGHYIAYPFKNESFYNTIPLTNPPSIPSTLRGLNNITTTANGNIDVSFYTH